MVFCVFKFTTSHIYPLGRLKMRPIWFLDVDGVLNALSKIEQRHIDEFPVWNEKEVNGYKIRYAPEVIDFINRMSERVDIKWNTTWQTQAVTLLAPALGLNKFDVVEARGISSPSGSFNRGGDLPENRWWKLNTVLENIEGSAADFIWTDDHLIGEVRHYTRRKADFEGIEHLIITPDGEMGLTCKDLLRIEDFVSTLEKYSTP